VSQWPVLPGYSGICAEHKIEASAHIPGYVFDDGFFDKKIQLIQMKLPGSISHGYRTVAAITWVTGVVIDAASRPTAEIHPIWL
jgi:hypothetical protein